MLNTNQSLIFTIIFTLFTACASQQIKFKDADPVRYYNDIHPIPVPKEVHYNIFDYYAQVLPPRPTIKTLLVSPNKNAKDINSFDEVPGSSWFFPRLGYFEMSPEELLYGPSELGPPVPPITVIRVRKPEKNPRLFIYDSRGIHYLLKFDPPDYPAISTSTSFIVNRLFWGFGYHVPEDHLFHFSRDQVIISRESNLTAQDMDQIFSRVAAPVNGRYRSVSSRIIKGLPLGPAPATGVRKNDPNDLFPHEERRVLRGLKVFCTFTNMVDISSDNLFDIYVGEEGQGFIKHYIIDFDDAFGTNAARHQRLWSGYNHLFDFKDITQNLFTAGLIVHDWEKIKATAWKSVGTYESTFFKPEDWKETHPFKPIRNSTLADDYWAAKILGALSKEHIEILVKAAQYPELDAEKYMIKTLLERRRKIVEYYLKNITPVEAIQFLNGKLFLQDMEGLLLNKDQCNSRFKISFYNDENDQLSKEIIFTPGTVSFSIPISETLMYQANYYLRVDISVERKNKTVSPPAQFHLLKSKDNKIKLVGVVH